EGEAQKEHHAEGQKRLDQPRAQLDQMLHQRSLGRFDVLVGHAALPASGLGGTESALSSVAVGAASAIWAGAAAGAPSGAGAGLADSAAVAGVGLADSAASPAGGGAGSEVDGIAVLVAGALRSGSGPAAFSMSLRISSTGSKRA